MKLYNINHSKNLVSIAGYNVSSLQTILSKIIKFAEKNDLIHIEILDRKKFFIKKHYFHKKGAFLDLYKSLEKDYPYSFKNNHQSHLLSTSDLIEIINTISHIQP